MVVSSTLLLHTTQVGYSILTCRTCSTLFGKKLAPHNILLTTMPHSLPCLHFEEPEFIGVSILPLLTVMPEGEILTSTGLMAISGSSLAVTNLHAGTKHENMVGAMMLPTSLQASCST